MTVGGVQKAVGDAQIYGTYNTGQHWGDSHSGFLATACGKANKCHSAHIVEFPFRPYKGAPQFSVVNHGLDFIRYFSHPWL
jgi:hypothetical protein